MLAATRLDGVTEMARFNGILVGAAASVTLLAGCTETGFAQNAHVVTAGTLADDVAAHDDYRWIDRARALWDAVGDSPPDYGFAFDGGSPVAWDMRDGYWVVVEDRPEGARSYFFAPGERGPFLIRETDRSFGYQDGHVAAVYDGGGTLQPRYIGARWLDEGEALYRRGRRLRDALLDRQWEPVDTGSWVNLNLFFVGIDERWDSGWRARNDSFAYAEQQRWAEERARRAAMAAMFARWRSGGFQGPPPPGLGGHWNPRPPRPGQPPVVGQPGRPPVPPQPGDGRPGRPWMWGGEPGSAGGTRPNRPPRGEVQPGQGQGTITSPSPNLGAAPPPTAGTPGWQGGWQGGRPGDPARPQPPRPEGGATRPPRGDGGGRPGWLGPRPDGDGSRPGWTRPGWTGGDRPQRPPTASAPPAAAPATPNQPAPPAAAPARENNERRGGGWMSPGWMRQTRPDATGAVPPSGGEQARPAFRPPVARPEGITPPPRPAFTPPPAPHAAPPPPAPRPASPPPAEHRQPSPLLREKLEARSEDRR